MPGQPQPAVPPRSRAGSRAPKLGRAGVRVALTLAATAGFTTLVAAGTPAGAAPAPYLSHFQTVNNIGSTVPNLGLGVPGNGDLNPYGIVQVQQSEGKLVAGETLVSNFNASSNLQGTGTTIVEMAPNGTQTVFAQIDASNLPGPCPGGVGLTTALTIVGDGFVVVGSLPVTNAGLGTPQAGCLIVLNNEGVPVETFAGPDINGPWDLTAAHFGFVDELFVTNVLNNTVLARPKNDGTVVRLDLFDWGEQAPILLQTTVIATGFAEQLNGTALVIGPTGDALGANDTLYVADTLNNRIMAVSDASTRSDVAKRGGNLVSQGGALNGPLGMTLAPNGDILTVNGNDPNAVETTPQGNQVDVVQFDPAGLGGDLFGLTIAPGGQGVLFVDDGDNTLKQFGPD